MKSRALTRLALIVALVGTAHMLKPISGRSIATHLLDAVDSIALVLPKSTAAHLAQANYIAAAFSRSFDESRSSREGVWVESAMARPSLLAVSQPEPGIETRAKKPARRPLVARHASRVKPIELPVIMPLKRTLALDIALPQIAFAKMPMQRYLRPARPIRVVFKATPAMMPAARKKTECEMPVIAPNRVAEDEGPIETETTGPMIDVHLDAIAAVEAVMKAIETITGEAETEAPAVPHQKSETPMPPDFAILPMMPEPQP
jgi:hypothetical protein